jgi:hypothetical protein
MQMAGHKLSLVDETPVALKVAELHQLRGFMGKSNGGHILLLATGVRIIRTPDREAELLEHSYCSFRMPSVLAMVLQPLCGVIKERLRAILPVTC